MGGRIVTAAQCHWDNHREAPGRGAYNTKSPTAAPKLLQAAWAPQLQHSHWDTDFVLLDFDSQTDCLNEGSGDYSKESC